MYYNLNNTTEHTPKTWQQYWTYTLIMADQGVLHLTWALMKNKASGCLYFWLLAHTTKPTMNRMYSLYHLQFLILASFVCVIHFCCSENQKWATVIHWVKMGKMWVFFSFRKKGALKGINDHLFQMDSELWKFISQTLKNDRYSELLYIYLLNTLLKKM